MPEWASKTLKTDLMVLLNDLYPKQILGEFTIFHFVREQFQYIVKYN